MGTILSAVLGFPNIHKVFTDGVIQLVSKDPSLTIIVLVSILKIVLVIASVAGFIQLLKNIKLTCNRTRGDKRFDKFMIKLTITGVLSFIGALLLRQFLHL